MIRNSTGGFSPTTDRYYKGTAASVTSLVPSLSCHSIQDSVLTTLPHIGHFMAALTCGLLVDHVRESGIVSTTTARKLVVYTGALWPSL